MEFRVATVNTLLGRALKDLSKLGDLATADILLIQEVIRPAENDLQNRLRVSGFELIEADNPFGLVIAIRKDSNIKLIDGTLRLVKLGNMGWMEKTILNILIKAKHNFKERGMMTVKFRIGNKTLTVVNVHPGISFGFKGARRRQINKLNVELKNTIYQGPLLIAGDMNHYPGPEKVDMQLVNDNYLRSLDLGRKPTWITKGSDYEFFAKLAAIFSRRALESFDGQLDAIYYRESWLQALETKLVTIDSDHRAILATFKLS